MSIAELECVEVSFIVRDAWFFEIFLEERTDFGDLDVRKRFGDELVEFDEFVEFKWVVDIDD